MTYREVRNNPDHPMVIHAIEYVEKNFPKTAANYKLLGGEGIFYRYFCTKQLDYGPENIRSGYNLLTNDGKALSQKAIGKRMNDKTSRIDNLTTKIIEKKGVEEAITFLKNDKDLKDTGAVTEKLRHFSYTYEPANESLEDAFVDVSIYGVIACIVEEGNWGQ